MPKKISAERLQQLERLRSAYRTELPERLDAIVASWNDVREGRDVPTQWETLKHRVHSLAGSAGTFGYDQLGRTAREIERWLANLTVEVGLTAEQQTRIGSSLAMLRSLASEQPMVVQPMLWIPPEGGAELGNRRLYIVEDDRWLAEELGAQLAAFGWDVHLFVNATAAEKALEQEFPAAVIVDLTLPEGQLAGASLIQRIQHVSPAYIPRIVLSSHWDWNSRLSAARGGADAYFLKPVDIAALVDRLDSLTHRAQRRPYRILVVEDTLLLADHYVQVLTSAGMECRAIYEPHQLLDALADLNPELILMDLYMPECSGIEAARVVRHDPKFTSLPIVFLSTETARQQQLAAMQIGADDFLQKPITDSDLVSAVSVRAERFRALTALISQDSLTGLLNHIAFKLQLEAEIARASRNGVQLMLAMLDIDHFKQINDRYGHPVGDRVIRSLSQLLRKRLRKSDIVGRYGGEEFAVVMPETCGAAALAVMDAMREQFALIQQSHDAEFFRCTFSVGLAPMFTGCRVDDLIDKADQALYKAKAMGRNRVVMAES